MLVTLQGEAGSVCAVVVRPYQTDKEKLQCVCVCVCFEEGYLSVKVEREK